MKLFTKQLFITAALSLAVASALHGNVQESIDTLKKLIDTANAHAFRESCTAFLNSEVTTQERNDALTTLEQHTQGIKQLLQNKRSKSDDTADTNNSIDAHTIDLGKGIAQTVVGALLAMGVIDYTKWVLNDEKRKTFHKKYLLRQTDQLCQNLAKFFGLRINKYNTPANIVIALVHVIGGAYLSYLLLTYGIANCKRGWKNQKKEPKRHKELDEIIACIQRAKKEVAQA